MTEFFRATWVVAYRDVLRFVSDRSRLLPSLTYPLLFLAIFGAGFNNVVGTMAPGVDLITFQYPGIIAMAVLTNALFAGVSVAADREAGFLKEILVAPLSRTGIVVGKQLGATSVALLQAAILLVLAPLVGVRLEPGTVLALVPVIVILALALSGLGILLGSFGQSQQGFQTWMQLLIFPMIFLAGVFFPVDSVPDWMAVLSKINPVTYGVDAIRQIFLGSASADAGLGVTVAGHAMTVVEEVAVVGVLGAVLFGAAVWAFARQE
jgi:ABC-2 type transport system permease protein